jgi:hypothetical protein
MAASSSPANLRLDGLLDHLNAILFLESLDQRSADVHGHGSQDALP